MASKHYPALDGLRGVAALFIVFYHVPWATHFVDTRLVRNGYLAVDVFFIMSGFVIAANYGDRLRTPQSIREFAVRRFFRLYPLHFAVLMAVFALELVKWALRAQGLSDSAPFTGAFTPGLLVVNLLMLQGLGLVRELGWNPPAWSIGAECVAYAFFAVVAARGDMRPGRNALLAICLASGALVALAAIKQSLDVNFGWGLVRCLAGFTLGVAIWLYEPGDWPFLPVAATVSGALAITVMTFADGASIILAIPLFVAMVVGLRSGRGLAAQLLSSAPAQFLGKISFSVYMIHMTAFYLATGAIKRLIHQSGHPMGRFTLEVASPWIGDLLFVVVLAAVLSGAAVTYRLIEAPARDYGKRIARRFA